MLGAGRRQHLASSLEPQGGELLGHSRGAYRHVGASAGWRQADWVGRVGTVERAYGHPDYLAIDVHFEDGSVELYWYHELEVTEVSSLA